MDPKPVRCSINDLEFRLFRDYIADISGIILPPEKAYLIETRLSKLMLDSGAESFGEFYGHIKQNKDPDISGKIINAITINETMWFRDSAPWKVLEGSILPGLAEELANGKKTRARFWFAAASTGQEAYSTVMCVEEYLKNNSAKGLSLSNFDFFATDLSSSALDIAKRGRYDKINIKRGLDDHYRDKYFKTNGLVWELDPKIIKAVRFERFNLQEGYDRFGLFDVIFCRYVLIYFSVETKKEIAAKMRDSLTENGVLFTGNYVIYDLLKDGFESRYHENLTYYLKKGGIQ